MSILGRAIRELRHLDASFGASLAEIPPNSALGGTWAGVPVSPEGALRVTTVWACVSLISDAISMLPLGVFRARGPARVPAPEPAWIEEPVEGMDRVEWLGRLMVSLLLRGNAYALIVSRDRLGFPTQFLPLHPDEVRPRLAADGRVSYEVHGHGSFAAADVLHIRGLTLPGQRHLEGLSPIGYARQTIGTALAAEEFGARWFGDGGHPSGILVAEGKIDEDLARRYQQMWLESHGQRHRKPAVLGSGLKWQPITITPEESQFLETIKAKHSDIAGFFRVPPHLISDVERSTSWGRGIEEQGLQFVQFTLGIWLVRLERALSKQLPRPRYVKFNVSGFLRGRQLDRYQAYLMARQGGWLSIDEVRALEEMAPLPEGKGEDYLMPLNYAPIPPKPEDVTEDRR